MDTDSNAVLPTRPTLHVHPNGSTKYLPLPPQLAIAIDCCSCPHCRQHGDPRWDTLALDPHNLHVWTIHWPELETEALMRVTATLAEGWALQLYVRDALTPKVQAQERCRIYRLKDNHSRQ